MTACETFETQIALYVEGDLPVEDRAGLLTHLAACAACRTFARELEESQRALKSLADDELDAEALSAVRQRVAAALDRPAPRHLAWMLTAAAALLMAAFLLSRQEGGPRVLPPMAQVPTGPPTAVTPAPAPPPLATARASASPKPRLPASPAVEPMFSLVPEDLPTMATAGEAPPPIVKLVTADPDVVIYWATDSIGGQS